MANSVAGERGKRAIAREETGARGDAADRASCTQRPSAQEDVAFAPGDGAGDRQQ